ncbi:MAG TPA: peptidylprolyl isomerase [Thermoanaerobaculia bacterium]|nr:peptidylprolyl isomerase [Thermoanaerobaculia bacterium]
MIKRTLIPLLLLVSAAFAQQAPPAQNAPAPQSTAAANVDDAKRPVAVVNGETITVEKLNRMYANLSTQMRTNYDQNGGKGAFLENYVRKRLLLQEAFKTGFDKKPEVVATVESARESALFDRYVRDVVASGIVTDKEIRDYYDAHPDDFATPEKVHVRHIVIAVTNAGPAPKTDGQAIEQISKIAAELRASDVASAMGKPDLATLAKLRLAHFEEAAKKYSEDGSAASGGDLGWMSKGQLDPAFEAAAWGLKPGVISGIVHTKFGYHLILVEGKEPAGTEPFDAVKNGVREYLMTQKATDVVNAVARLTNELKANSRISVFPENIK